METVKTEMKGTSEYFFISGEIDHHNAKTIRKMIDSDIFIKRPENVCLDLSQVDFMDSSGLGLIMGRYKTATEMGLSFKIVNPSERIVKILKLAGCDKLLTIERRK